jgi:hypothetical protein
MSILLLGNLNPIVSSLIASWTRELVWLPLESWGS